MYTVGEVDKYLSSLAPSELSESWDNDGVMVCKSKDSKADRILVALEATDKVIDYAVKGGFDLIVTHHPFIFKRLSRISGSDYENITKLIQGGISLLSYHTRLDSAEGGVNDVLAASIGLSGIVPFGGETGNIGRMGRLEKPMTSRDFALFLKGKLGCDIRCALAYERLVKTVAVVGGAGKDYIFEGVALGADAFVTAEIPHHLFIAASKESFSLYDCGHYYTENPVCDKLYSLLNKKFPNAEIEVYDVKCPYTCI